MQTQKEITRDSLHSSLKNKPKEVQDRFLEVVNENIRKGNNTSSSINAGNKAVIELEKILQEQATEEKLKIEKSNKNIYFYVEEWNGASWNIGRYTARQIRLVNNTEDQVQITAARYFKTGSKLRCYIWADATVELRSTDLPGTTVGTVTLPAFRLNIA